MKSNIVVTYDKYYTDDTGKNIPELFTDIKIKEYSVKSFWENVVDAFYKIDSDLYFTCIGGDLRIVSANEQGNNNFKFSQYFISGLDGKVIKIPAGTWFGIHNLGTGNAIVMSGATDVYEDFEKMSKKIFNWYSKK